MGKKGNNIMTCYICDKVFKNKLKCQAHLISVHTVEEDKEKHNVKNQIEKPHVISLKNNILLKQRDLNINNFKSEKLNDETSINLAPENINKDEPSSKPIPVLSTK